MSRAGTASDPAAAAGSRTSRSDALRNRDRLLVSAALLVAAEGTSVPLDDVAREAGLSSGTLYRNFRSRADLLRALYDTFVDDTDTLVERVLAAPTGWDAIVTYIDGVIALIDAHPESPAVIGYMRRTEPDHRPGDHWAEPATRTAERARREGSVRPDLSASDIAYLPRLLVPLVQWPEPQRGHQLARMRTLLLDAIRNGPERDPLPEQPLSVAELRRLSFSGDVGEGDVSGARG